MSHQKVTLVVEISRGRGFPRAIRAHQHRGLSRRGEDKPRDRNGRARAAVEEVANWGVDGDGGYISTFYNLPPHTHDRGDSSA